MVISGQFGDTQNKHLGLTPANGISLFLIILESLADSNTFFTCMVVVL